MSRSKPTATSHEVAIPKSGSLALLAAGHRALRAWREVRGTDWIDALVELPVREGSTADAAAPPAPGPRAMPAPETLAGLTVVVVSGLPRSGTSMMMQMLEAGGLVPFTDGVRDADSSNPRGYYEHDAVKSLRRDASWLGDADGHVVKVVAPLIASLPTGPRYVVVFMDRELGQLVRSQAAMLTRDGRDSADPVSLRASYERFRSSSLGWAERTDRTDVIRIDHAEAIQAPQAIADRVATFLETQGAATSLDRAAMTSVVDASLHRQRDAD